MDTTAILAALLSERDRLNQAIAALEALDGTTSSSAKPGRKPATVTVPTAPKKRVLSAASRKKMADAAKQRWAAKKAAEKKPAAKAPAVKKVAPKKVALEDGKEASGQPRSPPADGGSATEALGKKEACGKGGGEEGSG